MQVCGVGILPEIIKFLFSKDLGINFGEYKGEFEELRLAANIHRCKKGAAALLLLNIVLLIIDLVVYKPMREETPAYLYLYYSHLVIVVLILLWFTFVKGIYKYNNRVKNAWCHVMYNSTIYWCAFMAINALNISGQITAYTICTLTIAAYIYLTPSEGFFTIITSMIVIIVLLVQYISDTSKLYSHIINIGAVVFFSIIISNLNYSSFAKDFINKKDILRSRKELEEKNEKLREYERLRTDFLANISHELRTPLNVIYSAQQMLDTTLKTYQSSNGKTDKYLKMMKQNSYRLIRLINNLIDITKIDSANFEVKLRNSDIIKIVEDITMSVADYIENKGITLVFDTEIEEKIIACDGDIVERIVLNLLSNAVKFTDRGGYIYVNIYVEADNICIVVKDTGIGIPDKMKKLIFDRFIQVDKSISRRREGSGIGLSLVKSLLEVHGGTISAESVIGQGSTFKITLPDRQLEKKETDMENSNSASGSIEMISIEFSDIYD
jgi:signal transduction histidine kinase